MRATNSSVSAPPEPLSRGHGRSGDVGGPPGLEGSSGGTEMTVKDDASALDESLLGVLPGDVLIEVFRGILPVDLPAGRFVYEPEIAVVESGLLRAFLAESGVDRRPSITFGDRTL